jgi:hypothetical protein
VGWVCGTYGIGEKRGHDFGGKLKGKRPLVRPKRRWDDGIKMGVREIGWEVVEWIQLAEDMSRRRSLVNSVLKLRILIARN